MKTTRHGSATPHRVLARAQRALARLLLLWIVSTFQARAPADVPSPAAAEDLHLATFDAAWRIINESYFDPNFNGLDWEAVRTELRPQAQAAKDVSELRHVIESMLQRLGDSHMAVIPRDLARSLDRSAKGDSNGNGAANAQATVGDGDLGLEIRLIADRPLVTRIDNTGPAGKAGVKPGWIVQAIDDQPVPQLLESLQSQAASPRAQFMAWRLLTGELAGAPGSTVSVQFLNGLDRVVSLTMERRREQGEPARLGYLPTLYARFESETLSGQTARKVGLMRFNLWMIPVIRAFDERMDELRDADGIILDLRGNLGGLGGMTLGVAGHFLGDRVSLGTMKMRGNQLHFYANPRRVSVRNERVEPYAGPVAILIDSLSLSAAEIFAGGMQALGRARVFGETSGGQALPAIWDRLPNGDVLYHAFGDFVTGSGLRLEGRGVHPDESVPVTRGDVLAGRDAPLQAALGWIDQEVARRTAALSLEN